MGTRELIIIYLPFVKALQSPVSNDIDARLNLSQWPLDSGVLSLPTYIHRCSTHSLLKRLGSNTMETYHEDPPIYLQPAVQQFLGYPFDTDEDFQVSGPTQPLHVTRSQRRRAHQARSRRHPE